MTTSPTLKTLESGQLSGMAKTSPSHHTRADSTMLELPNASVGGGKPALRHAHSEAGIVPPLAAIAIRFMSPPAAITNSPGRCRLLHTNRPASAKDSMCSTSPSVAGNAGIRVIGN